MINAVAGGALQRNGSLHRLPEVAQEHAALRLNQAVKLHRRVGRDDERVAVVLRAGNSSQLGFVGTWYDSAHLIWPLAARIRVAQVRKAVISRTWRHAWEEKRCLVHGD